jgi:organic radical activating enzyme
MTDLYCPMIHGGLNINFKNNNGELGVNQCCLSTEPLISLENNAIWKNSRFTSLREANNKNQWDSNCWECKRIEDGGLKSFRKSMLEHYGKKYDLSGPLRIDFLFDRGCNLACSICSPEHSTLWQQYVKQNNIPFTKLNNSSDVDKVIAALKNLDLSNLEQVHFCGGDTLLGTSYWKLAEALVELVPDAGNKLLVGFQTNGTQPVDPKYYEILEKFNLVKIFISIDGIGEKFNYLRWPGDWNQMTDNIMQLREKLPVNVMFMITQTLSNFSLFYADEVTSWVKTNFSANRLGDAVEHSQQLAMHNLLGIDAITEEYVQAIKDKNTRQMLPYDWKEDPDKIKKMLNETAKHDKIRGNDWKKTFPEVAEFYSRYL